MYIRGKEPDIKSGRRIPNVKCKAQGTDKVVVIGGYISRFPFFRLCWLTNSSMIVVVAALEQCRNSENMVTRGLLP